MRVLITGGAGFVGRYMAAHLLESGCEVVAFDVDFPTPPDQRIDTVRGDLLDTNSLDSVVSSVQPDACIHLGAISYVPAGNDTPSAMLSVNISGTINLIQAFRKNSPASKILVASTSHIYGTKAADKPINEDTMPAPISTYAVSKAAADLTSLACAREYDMHIMTARPNNHTGPGQDPRFAVPSFAAQVAAIARKEAEPRILTGNLESTRCFLDVRDVVRAYSCLLKKGQPGRAYNISSDTPVRIGDLLNMLCQFAGISPEIVTDPSKYRPTDCTPVLDTSRLKNDTGWQPEIELNKTLQDILELA